MVKLLKRFGIGFVILFLCTIGDAISIIWMILALLVNSERWWKIAHGKDQSYNAVFGGNDDETISSRAGRAMIRGEKWGCVLCKFLDIFEKDHCIKSIEQDSK